MAMQYIALSRTGWLATIAAAALAALAPAPADGYCVMPKYATDLRDAFPSLQVPVYISIGANSTVEHLGVTQEDMARLVLEVIARHNETTVAPKLYFAGFSSIGLKTMTDDMPVDHYELWQKGITIHSLACEEFASGHFPKGFLCDFTEDKHHGCGVQHTTYPKKNLVGIVFLLPAMCKNTANSLVEWSIDGSTQYDIISVLLHEIGHVLGFRHANIAAADCGKKNLAGNDPAGNTGVMRAPLGASLTAYRHWRRDDIDGFDALYADNYLDYELAHWPDDNFPDAPAISKMASSLSAAPMIRSGSLADVPIGSHEQPLVTLDVERHVVFATLAPDGSVIQPPQVVDPSARGVTVGSPDVALGRDRVFVTWTAGEAPTSEELQPRWAVRPLSGGAWSLFDGPPRKNSRLTAGFDAGTSAWLLGSFSSAAELEISLIDHDGALLLDAAPLGVLAFDFGNPLCGSAGPGCTMWFTTSELGGPNLARVDFDVGLDPPQISVDNIVVFDGQDSYGHVDAAASDPGWLRVVAGLHRVEVGAGLGSILAPEFPPLTQLREWPLTLGRQDGEHRMATLVAVECGNGIVQSEEACDDGNLDLGDGCDDVCEVEAGETGGSEDMGDTGGGPGLDDGGCACGGGVQVPGVEFLLGALVFGPRRRRPTK